jgi:hypothetical protein
MSDFRAGNCGQRASDVLAIVAMKRMAGAGEFLDVFLRDVGDVKVRARLALEGNRQDRART